MAPPLPPNCFMSRRMPSELLEQSVHVLHPLPATARYAFAAASVDHRRIAPLSWSHGVDDGDTALQVLLSGVGIDALECPAHSRDHGEHLFEGPHLPDLFHLITVVLEGELASAQLPDEGLGLLEVDGLLDFPDEAEDVTHAEDTANHS